MEGNQSDRAYQYLRRKILNRELVPGTRVRYGPVGKEIGVSATPVREAIGKLAHEGLVELVPQSGAIVKTPTRKDAIEVYEMREAIEPFAAMKACQLIGRKQFKTMEESLDVMRALHAKAVLHEFEGAVDKGLFDRADLEFHLTILEAADNQRMLKAVADYHLLTGIIGAERHDYDAEVLAMTIEDHEAILSGLAAREPEEVRRSMVTHIRNSRQLTLSLLDGGVRAWM